MVGGRTSLILNSFKCIFYDLFHIIQENMKLFVVITAILCVQQVFGATITNNNYASCSKWYTSSNHSLRECATSIRLVAFYQTANASRSQVVIKETKASESFALPSNESMGLWKLSTGFTYCFDRELL